MILILLLVIALVFVVMAEVQKNITFTHIAIGIVIAVLLFPALQAIST